MFFAMRKPHVDSRHLMIVEDWEYEVPPLQCPRNSGHRNQCGRIGRLILNPPPLLVRPHDILWTWGSDLLLPPSTIELFRREGITGYYTRPATVLPEKRPRPDRPIPPLEEVVVTGWGGMAAKESGIKLKYRCKGCCHTEYTGAKRPEKIIDPAQWDGSDIFMVWPLVKFKFISQRLADIVSDHKLIGVTLLPQNRFDFYAPGGFGSGRLRGSMPDERAHELGDALGIY